MVLVFPMSLSLLRSEKRKRRDCERGPGRRRVPGAPPSGAGPPSASSPPPLRCVRGSLRSSLSKALRGAPATAKVTAIASTNKAKASIGSTHHRDPPRPRLASLRPRAPRRGASSCLSTKAGVRTRLQEAQCIHLRIPPGPVPRPGEENSSSQRAQHSLHSCHLATEDQDRRVSHHTGLEDCLTIEVVPHSRSERGRERRKEATLFFCGERGRRLSSMPSGSGPDTEVPSALSTMNTACAGRERGASPPPLLSSLFSGSLFSHLATELEEVERRVWAIHWSRVPRQQIPCFLEQKTSASTKASFAGGLVIQGVDAV